MLEVRHIIYPTIDTIAHQLCALDITIAMRANTHQCVEYVNVIKCEFYKSATFNSSVWKCFFFLFAFVFDLTPQCHPFIFEYFFNYLLVTMPCVSLYKTQEKVRIAGENIKVCLCRSVDVNYIYIYTC